MLFVGEFPAPGRCVRKRQVVVAVRAFQRTAASDLYDGFCGDSLRADAAVKLRAELPLIKRLHLLSFTFSDRADEPGLLH